ncbi:MAG TPA: NUDIX hydrolase [Chthoniobacterales bacterium]|nr:NUDIX hydrolase [Chthoniobacterales bacterium]
MRFTNLVRPEKDWEIKSATIRWGDNHLSVATELIKTPTNPEPRTWTVVHRKAAVVIAPMTEEGEFLLVRQERVPIQATIWEMPAGQIDDNAEPDETQIRSVALRELHEETGFDLSPEGQLVSLGHFFSSPGFTDEHCYLFLARPVIPSPAHKREEGEGILDCRAFRVEQLNRMIAENEIRDSNTLCMCARLAARGFFSVQAS